MRNEQSFPFDECRIALESIQSDRWRDFQHGIALRPEDHAVLLTQIGRVEEQYGLESSEFLTQAWDVTKRLTAASQKRVGLVIESVQVFLDDSGQKEVERMSRLLEETQGDGSGVFVNQKLADRLQIKGDVPKTFDQSIAALRKFSDHITDQTVPKIANVLHHASVTLGPSYVRTTEELQSHLDKLLKYALEAGPPTQWLPADAIRFVTLGGRHLVTQNPTHESATRSTPHDGEMVAQLREHIKTGALYRITRDPSRVDGTAYNARLPVLSRHQIGDVIRQCEQLTALITKLIATYKHHRKDADGSYIAQHLADNLSAMKGKVSSDKNTQSLHDTGHFVSHEERQRAEALGQFYRLPLMDHLTLLEGLCAISIRIHQSLSTYVHASLAHYR